MADDGRERGLMLLRFVRAALRLRETRETALRKAECRLTPQGLEVLLVLGTRGPVTRAVGESVDWEERFEWNPLIEASRR